jgi:hypothetical protein
LRLGYGKEIGPENEDEAIYPAEQCYSQEGKESLGGGCATLYPLELRPSSQNAKDYTGKRLWHI